MRLLRALLPLLALLCALLRPRSFAHLRAASGVPYTRPFAAPSSFGRPGLSHVTLHGAVAHGAAELELWRQSFAPGAGTPIHHHACEEVFVILQGSGSLFSRSCSGCAVTELRFGANATLVIPPSHVHQLRNTGEELLTVLVAFSRPPMRAFVYDSWQAPVGRLRMPYDFDV